MLPAPDVTALEKIVDSYSLGAVVDAMAHICREKEAHLCANWQDFAAGAGTPMTLHSWRPDRRAAKAHIRKALERALWEKSHIATKPDDWKASTESLRWRDDARAKSLKTLARGHLEYWRYRAFLGTEPGQTTLYPTYDRPMRQDWMEGRTC